MILTALRFRGPSDKEFRTWRFTSGVGDFRNFLAFHVDVNRLEDVVAAMDYALTGRVSSKIVEVAIQISDSAGESWIVQRTGKQVRYLRNNSPVSADEAQISLLASLLDFDVDGAESGTHSSGPKQDPKAAKPSTGVRRISATSRGLVASPWTNETTANDKLMSKDVTH